MDILFLAFVFCAAVFSSVTWETVKVPISVDGILD